MDQNSAPRLPALILLKSMWPLPASCARSKFSSTKRPGVSAWVSTTSAELWMACQPVARPLGEIVIAFDFDLDGTGVGGVAVCAKEKVESSRIDTTTRIMGMKLEDSDEI